MEKFFTDYQYTFSAFGSVGTCMAVIISLYFGYNAITANKVRLKAVIYKGLYILDSSKKEYIYLHVKNIGLVPAKIPYPFLAFKLPFYKFEFLLKVLDFEGTDFNVPKKVNPYSIPPKDSETFFVCETNSFFTQDFSKKLNLWLVSFISAKIYTTDGSIFNVTIDKKIKALIKDNLNKQREM